MVCSMTLTALSLVATVIILNVFYHDPSRRVPHWLRKSVLGVLARGTCFRPRAKSNQTVIHMKQIPENVSVTEAKEERGAGKDQDKTLQHGQHIPRAQKDISKNTEMSGRKHLKSSTGSVYLSHALLLLSSLYF